MLFGVATVVFFIARLTGDPVSLMVPPDATVAQEDALRHSLGLDKPLIVQYGIFISQVVHLNLGESLRYNQPTLQLVAERLPATLELAGAALAFSLIVAIPAGILAAVKRGSFIEGIAMLVALLGQSMPAFWIGILLIMLFAVHWTIFSASGMGGFSHLVLPAITLGLYLMAMVTRLLRTSLIDSLSADYIRTAKAKGLSGWKVIIKHALRNSSLPVVTVVGLEIGSLLGGSVVTETVFAWPGVGQLLVQAIYNRDYPLVQGAVLVLAGIFVIINLLVDVAYVILDPRIHYD